jgi:hypothetical protein
VDEEEEEGEEEGEPEAGQRRASSRSRSRSRQNSSSSSGSDGAARPERREQGAEGGEEGAEEDEEEAHVTGAGRMSYAGEGGAGLEEDLGEAAGGAHLFPGMGHSPPKPALTAAGGARALSPPPARRALAPMHSSATLVDRRAGEEAIVVPLVGAILAPLIFAACLFACSRASATLALGCCPVASDERDLDDTSPWRAGAEGAKWRFLGASYCFAQGLALVAAGIAMPWLPFAASLTLPLLASSGLLFCGSPLALPPPLWSSLP